METLHVIAVEDSAVHQRLLQQAFDAVAPGTQLQIHADAESAWEAIEGLRFQARMQWPAFAIVDIGLPRMSGIEFVDRVRKVPHFEDWPIVILTASTDPEDRAESLLADATLYARKPVTGSWVPLVEQMLDLLGIRHEGPRAKPKPEPAPRRKVRSSGHSE